MNNTKSKIYTITIAGLLCAIGIVIPMFSPVKVLIEPASFTLASHVPIFIAMFLSPVIAGIVAIGTTLGFLFGGFPLPIVLRAATHVIFALCGAIYIKKRPSVLEGKSVWLFSFLIALLHAVCEVIAVTPLYLQQAMAPAYYTNGYFTTVILLVGVGSVVHSMVDFWIALLVWRVLKKARLSNT